MKVYKRVLAQALRPVQAAGDLLSGDRRPIVLVPPGQDAKARELLLERLAFYGGLSADDVEFTTTLTSGMLLSSRRIARADATAGPTALLDWRRGTFNVDAEANPHDGWAWWDFARHDEPASEVEKSAAARLRDEIVRLRGLGLGKAYLFGTGTSLEKADQRDWSDGYRIACNTVVRDRDMWHHLDPHFLVAGDAIYHFGDSAFARAFRADLKLRLAEGRTFFVYPAQFTQLVERELGEFADRLVPVPVGTHRRLNVDLSREFALPGVGNVLNLLLLPLGCTLSQDVYLWGFDGRAPDDKLFWSNSPRHSYPELMPTLLERHPAFFRHYVPVEKPTTYVQNYHGDALDLALQAAEAQGWRFTMLHKSWTPTLQKRFKPEES
jgi:hypothetical protein